jgi:hypothetical protein
MSQKDSQQFTEVVNLLGDVMRRLLATDEGLHAETLVASAGRMAGTMVVRGLLDGRAGLEPGQPVLAAEVDTHGRVLVDALLGTLRRLGHPDIGAGDPGATTATSRLSLLETQQLLEPWFRKTQEVSDLGDTDMARVAAVAAAVQVHGCRGVLDVERGCAIALHGLVESMKTVPAVVTLP